MVVPQEEKQSGKLLPGHLLVLPSSPVAVTIAWHWATAWAMGTGSWGGGELDRGLRFAFFSGC